MGEQRSTSLSLEELGKQTGESPERLREWRSLGLVGAPGQDAFGLRDVERVSLIQFCMRRGFSVETIVRAEEAEGDLLGRYLDQLFPSGIEPTRPLEEAAELAGLDAEPVRRFGDIVGLFDGGERVDRHDIEILRGWKIALDAGLPEDALFQLVRVYADSLGRVGEAEARLFHFYVHERLRDGGLSGLALRERTDAASQRMQELIEPAILYFHRKALARARREDLLLHLAEYSGEADTTGAPGQLRVAIVFLDLASFTPLTESMGDAAAAEVVARFSELVRESVNRHHGRVVERIGDAFMLAFTDSRDAVSSALDTEERTTQEAQFPALRGAIHFGPVLYREGGYVGSNVNVAARVASEAKRDQILVTAEVRREAAALPDVEFVPVGRRRLKGLAGELELFEVRRRAPHDRQTVVDPVCGMELSPTGIAASVTLAGKDFSFCSENCLRNFVESRT